MKTNSPKIYYNPYIYRKQIYKDNRKKSGIYCWYNLITNEIYVGKTINITNRMYCYFSIKYLRKELRKNNSLIYKSLLKYNHENFSLHILEYCQIKSLDLKEQHYINVLRPEYNVIKTKFKLRFRYPTKIIL